MAARRSALKLHKLDLLTCPTPAIFAVCEYEAENKKYEAAIFYHWTLDTKHRRIRAPFACGGSNAGRRHTLSSTLAHQPAIQQRCAASYISHLRHRLFAHCAAGGLRSKSKAVADTTNGFWENRSFQNYADYALTPAFQEGLDQLLALGAKQRCAMMCSEAVWWRCHRRIVIDHLFARDEQVFHLMNTDTIEPASFNSAAVVKDGLISYPAGH